MSHKVKQSNIKENTINSEVIQKVFVGSEFWVLLILIINLGCYKSFPLKINLVPRFAREYRGVRGHEFWVGYTFEVVASSVKLPGEILTN